MPAEEGHGCLELMHLCWEGRLSLSCTLPDRDPILARLTVEPGMHVGTKTWVISGSWPPIPMAASKLYGPCGFLKRNTEAGNRINRMLSGHA